MKTEQATPQSPSEQRLRLKPTANSRSHGDWIGHVARSSLIVRDRSSPDRPRRSSLGLLAPRDRHCPHRCWRSVQSRLSSSLVVARPSCSAALVQVLPASLTLSHSLTLSLSESLSLKWKLWLSLSLSLSLSLFNINFNTLSLSDSVIGHWIAKL